MSKFKVESGMQLLARLHRRPNLQSFYPVLFETGPKPGEVIEIIFHEDNASYLLMDIISEALRPSIIGGVEAGLVIFNTDGNMDMQLLENVMRKKLLSQACNDSQDQKIYTDKDLDDLAHKSFSNLNVLNIYDASQMYATLHNLEKILAENPNISLIIVDTLTAFYWSEQSFKITKMGAYLKNLLRLIQKVTKDYKITVLYTRPQYFNSSKEVFKNPEECVEKPMLEHINYRVEMLPFENGAHVVNVHTFSKLFQLTCVRYQYEIKWSSN